MMKPLQLIFPAVLAGALAAGCADPNVRVREEYAATQAEADVDPRSNYAAEPQTVVKETRAYSYTEDEEDNEAGIISGALSVVGDVLAFPFRVVGNFIDLLF